MSNFRKVLARAGSILLVVMCVIGMLIPAHAEDGNEVIPVTDVNLSIPSNIIMRNDVSEGANQDKWVDISVEPENYTDTLSFDVIDGNDAVNVTVESNMLRIIPKKGNRHATIRVSSSSGYSKEYSFNILEGSYATGIRSSAFNYGKSVGETLNIKEIIRDNLYAYDSTSENPDFTDELNQLKFSVSQYGNTISLDGNSGLVTCLSEGSAYITTQLACGDYVSFNITVTNSEVEGITFQSTELVLPWNESGRDLKLYLCAVPDEATSKINWDEVTWTSSNDSVLSNESSYLKSYFNFASEGETTVTAAYRNYSASMKVRIVDAENGMQFKKNSLYLSIGESENIEYELGKNNEIVSRSIVNGEECIQLNGDTVTAVADGSATIKYVDMFGNANYISVSVSPKTESISFVQEEYVFTMRPDGEESSSVEYGPYRWIYAEKQPFNSTYPVKYSVIDGDCISFPYGEGNNTVELKHTGTAIIKAETDNGLSATAKVTVKQGTYAHSFYGSDDTIKIKPGESVDLKEEVRKRLISGTESDDFTDELNELKFENSYDQKKYTISDDGILHALSAGNYYIYFRLANGDYCSLNIVVSDKEISMIRFEKNEFWMNVNSQDYMNNYLSCIPSYMKNTINTMEVNWSSSNTDIADFGIEKGQLYGKGIEGTTEITAEYKGLKATTTVHFINADSTFAPGDSQHGGFDVKLKKGEKTQLKYILGENNYVISKEISNEECVKFDPDTDTVEAVSAGNAIVTYTDRFHNQISFYITVPGEKVTLTDFKLWGDVTATVRPGEKGQTYYVNYETKPVFSNGESKITWEMEGDASILEVTENSSYTFSFRPVKAGTVTLRGTTENGLTDTCKITILEGNYISAFKNDEDRYSIKEGETLDLSNIAVKNAIPENQNYSDERLSYSIKEGDDVVSVDKNGKLTTKKEGKATVRITTTGGQVIDICIAVTSGVKGISFEQDYYSIPLKMEYSMQYVYSSLNLKTDPSYAIAGIDVDDIKFTSSDGYEIQNINQIGSDITLFGNVYYPGDFTVTAEYNGMKCSATVHVYEEKEQTELTLDKRIDIKNGFITAIPYSFGKEEKTECTLELMDNSGTLSLSSSKASGGVFSVKALKKGTTKIRVTSVDNPALYKDIVVHVKDNVKDDYSFTLFYNDEEVKPDSTGTYVMKYGKEYKYEFLSKSKPNTNYAVFPKLVDTGAITSAGGAGCGLFEDKKLFGESGGSKAGKTGSYTVELWPGASLKFRIISDFERAESGASKIHNNTGDSVQIDESQLGSLQNQLTEELPDKITKDSLNATVESISESSDDLIGLSETAKVQLDTDTTVSLSEDGKKLVYDITPSITVKACEGSNGRTIGEQEADVDKSVEMTLPTGNFINPDEPVYITHIKEDGTKYVYEGTYNEDGKTVSFTDPHGYSTFEITQDKASVPSDAIKPGVSDKNTTAGSDNKKADSVKSDKKNAVDTSDHSNIGMYAGITLSGMIIAVITIIFRMKHSKVN